MYSIIDIETTGLSPNKAKITEIAIYVHDGKKVVDEFSTLINPETEIPYRITQLTGINNKMVAGSPKFYEVAKKIVEMTEGTIFVGHNVHFDYNFVRKEFKEFGYDYKRDKICTVELSRKLLPGRRSYALAKICNELGIDIKNRHRAFGDAKATVDLFEILLKLEKNLKELTYRGLNTSLDRKLIDSLPRETGVYYFNNDKGDIIYIGKSINIHDRVMSHLSNNGSKKAVNMRNEIADIDFEITGSELVALLLESNEIKKHIPKYNRALRRNSFQWGIYSFFDESKYLRLKIEKNISDKMPLTSFSSQLAAKNHLFMLTEAFQLCQKLCGLFDTKGACFQYNIKQCNGACIQKEDFAIYNSRANQAIEPYRFLNEDFIIIDKGRNADEHSVVVVEHNKYLGYGFLNFDISELNSIEQLKECISTYPDNRDIRQIIRSYLKRNKAEKFLPI